MRATFLAIALAACGGTQQPAPTNGGEGSATAAPVHDTRTPFEQRRDAACKQIAPRLTSCAVDDAKADLAAGKTTENQFKLDTDPKVLQKNTEDFVDKCTAWRDMSSRQVRVLEVCDKQAATCSDLRDCLKNLQPPPS